MNNNQNNRGIGDNSDTATLWESLNTIVRKIIAGVLEKDLYYGLALDDHEDVRTATRVADRYKSLESLKQNIEWREEPIQLLKKFFYADIDHPNHFTKSRHGYGWDKYAIYRRDLNELKALFGKEVHDHFKDRVVIKDERDLAKEFPNED